jgi:hypothetical protein
LVPILKKKPNATGGETESTQDEVATIVQCAQCHGAFPGIWRIPPSKLFFVGKDAFTLCKDERDFFGNSGAFINHIEHDVNSDNPLIQEAFTGRMGLNALGRSLIDKFAREVIDRAKGDSQDALWRSLTKYPAPPALSHQDLIQMAHDWVDAQGGKFVGGSECGCKKHHYAIGVKETGVFDRDLADGGRAHGDFSGQGDVPLTFKDDGSFEGKATIPESFTESLTSIHYL